MEKIQILLTNRIKLIQFFFFILYLIIGINITKDYGISYDEVEYRQQGFIVLNYVGEKIFPEKTRKIVENRKIKFTEIDAYMWGTSNNFKIQHTLNALIEFIFMRNSNKSDVFYLRHYINFIISLITIIIFYKFLRLNFNHLISTIGSIGFILSPRIFADFFYSPNDIWSLFSLVCCLYCMLNFFRNKKLKYFYLFPIFLCIAINIRYINFYVYPIFLIFLFYFNKVDTQLFKKLINQLLILIFFLAIITPEVWFNPKNVLINLFSQMSFKYPTEIMFNGKLILSSELPWYYILEWIIISTPSMTIFLFFIGIVLFLVNLSKNIILKKSLKSLQSEGIMFLFFIIPIFAFIIFKPDIFNGWRHFYFLHITVIYFVCYLLKNLYKIKFKFFKEFFYSVLLINFVLILNWMILAHPYQNIFFNNIFKKYAENFELDYWGLSNVESLKYLLSIENGTFQISNFEDGSRADFSLNLLNQNKNKIKFGKPNDINSKYFISHKNKGFNDEYFINRGFQVIKEIKVDNIVIGRIIIRNEKN